MLPLLITALWLPLQAVAAIAMPFCRHAAEQAVQLDAAAAEEHCHGHGGNDASPPGSAAVDQDCDGCELCHLAGAGYMLPAMATAESHRFLPMLTQATSNNGKTTLAVSPSAMVFHSSRLTTANATKSSHFLPGICHTAYARPPTIKMR